MWVLTKRIWLLGKQQDLQNFLGHFHISVLFFLIIINIFSMHTKKDWTPNINSPQELLSLCVFSGFPSPLSLLIIAVFSPLGLLRSRRVSFEVFRARGSFFFHFSFVDFFKTNSNRLKLHVNQHTCKKERKVQWFTERSANKYRKCSIWCKNSGYAVLMCLSQYLV